MTLLFFYIFCLTKDFLENIPLQVWEQFSWDLCQGLQAEVHNEKKVSCCITCLICIAYTSELGIYDRTEFSYHDP